MKSVRPFLLALTLLAACSDDPPPPVEAEPAPAERPAAAPAPANVEPSPEEVPIVEDFEDEAEREVTADNLDAQLDALEQEIALDSK